MVGSGPAGLAAAQQLARAGHEVTVFEKNDRIGGLLRYGIPDFKMEKHHIDRRIAQMQAEGVLFRPNWHIGKDIPARQLTQDFDAVILAGGSEKSRDLSVPGRELQGIHPAMDFLPQQNKRNAGDILSDEGTILATGKHVIVIGGGDTGSDCIGTSRRQGATSVTQLEILPKPPEREDKALTWPNWPNRLRTSSSHEEGCERLWEIDTLSFEGEEGVIRKINCIKVEWKQQEGRWIMNRIPGSEFSLEADVVFLAMGFVHPVHEGMIEELGVALDERNNVKADQENYRTSVEKVFTAGDMRRGQSLVVWAIREGRQCARAEQCRLDL